MNLFSAKTGTLEIWNMAAERIRPLVRIVKVIADRVDATTTRKPAGVTFNRRAFVASSAIWTTICGALYTRSFKKQRILRAKREAATSLDLAAKITRRFMRARENLFFVSRDDEEQSSRLTLNCAGNRMPRKRVAHSGETFQREPRRSGR